jgi:hypothetical protein
MHYNVIHKKDVDTKKEKKKQKKEKSNSSNNCLLFLGHDTVDRRMVDGVRFRA